MLYFSLQANVLQLNGMTIIIFFVSKRVFHLMPVHRFPECMNSLKTTHIGVICGKKGQKSDKNYRLIPVVSIF